MSSEIYKDEYSTQYVNLSDPRLGAKPIFVTDDFFASCERMLNIHPPIFVPGKFDDNGKWMDGWESRRKREIGHDYCIVRLACKGVIRAVNIDTSHFIGNHPPSASIDACTCISGDPISSTEWTEILPLTDLVQDSQHNHEIQSEDAFTHIRLNIYPDGGIARLRIYGAPQCDWIENNRKEINDLVAVENGGKAITCSNQSFGSSIINLNYPGRGKHMGDGWETARRRLPGNEWVILELGHPGQLQFIEVDTAHYKGNYPDSISMQGFYVDNFNLESIKAQSLYWDELLPVQKLSMDSIHRFDEEVIDLGIITHVKVNIFPDGGLSRIRLFGRIEQLK